MVWIIDTLRAQRVCLVLLCAETRAYGQWDRSSQDRSVHNRTVQEMHTSTRRIYIPLVPRQLVQGLRKNLPTHRVEVVSPIIVGLLLTLDQANLMNQWMQHCWSPWPQVGLTDE